MVAFPWGLVTVDIDGTLTLVHGWQEIAHAFGREVEFEATHRRFVSHEVGEDEHLSALLALAAGHTVAEVDRVLEATPKLVRIAEGVAELHRLGATVALLTHNPEYVVDYYRRTFGFDDGDGIVVPTDADGRIAPIDSVRADKLGGLSRLITRHPVEPRQVVHVGDGWSDAEVFRVVGGGVALNSRLPEVNRTADRVLRTRDFCEVVDTLRTMAPRP